MCVGCVWGVYGVCVSVGCGQGVHRVCVWGVYAGVCGVFFGGLGEVFIEVWVVHVHLYFYVHKKVHRNDLKLLFTN